jgi:hypothetical protein
MSVTAVILPVSPVAAGDADVSGGPSHLVGEAELADHLGGQGGGGGQVVGATVLTDAKGLTLYSFAPDTPHTYVGEAAPGQAHGNNLNLNGGLWHEVTVSG